MDESGRKAQTLSPLSSGELEQLAHWAGLGVGKTRYADSLGFFAALGFRVFGNKNGHLSAEAVDFYDRYVVPLSRSFDFVFGRLLGKNIYLIASKN